METGASTFAGLTGDWQRRLIPGFGLVGRGMWGLKEIRQGIPVDGRYLALGGRR